MSRMRLIHILVTLGFLHLGECQHCPYNWLGYSVNSKCYRFVRATKLTWQDARDYCQTHGGDLLKLDSAAERNWVTRQVVNIAKHYSVSNSKWWTGLNNREYLKTWEWADGSPVGNFITWSPGEPNNHANEERCAEIVSGTKFNDQACSDQDFFICSRPRGLPLACDTDQQWQTLNGQCYKVYTEQQSWEGARSQCNSIGGSLATIENSAVESTIHDFAAEAKMSLWIGLHSLQMGEGNTWMWSNGSLLTTTAFWKDSPHVAPGQLNSSCVSVSNSLAVAQDWNSEACTTAKGFVCQKPQGVCFNGWIGHSSNCYQFDPQFRLPYTAAVAFCHKQGAQLLRIASNQDQMFIQSYLDEFRDSDATTIWLGLSDDNNDEGPYKWRDGQILGKYHHWAYRNNTPINNKGKMDCGYIASTDTRGLWRVTPSCQAARAVICTIPMGAPVSPMPATPRPRYGCPPNWQLHVDTCFLVGDTPYDQFTARTTCQQTPGADLAVIESADMQGFINNLIQSSQYYYIGLNDKSAEGVFIWNDNGAMSYTNWLPNEPNDSNRHESCVVIRNGGWNDIACGTKAPYICSMVASSVIPNTLAPTPTGDWTVKCGPGWESNPVTDFCYMFSDQPLIWTDALLQCHNNHGDLVYITSLEEQSYLAGRIKQMSSIGVWIGANDRRTESGWSWTAGKGFAYFNWGPGQPGGGRAAQGADCVAMLTQTSEWVDLACNTRNGFVCKKTGKVPHTRPPRVTTTALPAGMTWGCGQYWKKWRNYCYLFAWRKATPLNWKDADTQCRRIGARLSSINSRAEQNFITASLPNVPNEHTFRYWIGLNDIQVENRFQWSDGSDVIYTNWAVGEPNSWKNGDEDCVDVWVKNDKKTGQWNDQNCDILEGGYICKRPLYIVPINQTPSPDTVGCPGGSRGYGPYCYRTFTTSPKNWDDANAACLSAVKGTLATISDAYVQAYLSSRLVSYSGNAWVGLTDKDSPGVYTWASGHAVAYTAWDRNHTGNERSTCIAMRGTPIQGLWTNQDCSVTNGYVCQSPRSGYTVPPTPPTPYPNVACPMGWTENYAYCLTLYSDQSQKKNWMDALAFCQSLGGDLPSFHQNGNDSVVQSMTSGKLTVWIGLNDRDTEGGHTWSDGSAVDYTNWNPGEPNDWGKDEDCVVLTGGGSWNDINCFNPNSFICALPRGTSPMTTLAPPVPVESAQCSPGWIYYNSNCYMISPDTGANGTLNWYDAQSYCHSQAATLASFHSQQETSLITVAAQTKSSQTFWIGLYQPGNKAFQWTDGSAMDYMFWNVGEPNNYLGGEKCGGLYQSNGKWNDQLCTVPMQFICKKPLNGAANIIPAPNSPGGCPTGFSRVTGGRNKCFYIVRSITANWTDAYAYCRKLGNNVDLASIEDIYEQEFLLTMPGSNGTSLWIGLSDRRGSNQFFWLDNSPVVFTNWDRFEPTSYRVQGNDDKDDCVLTRSYQGHEGKWADKPCSVLKSFVCQTKQDPNIPIGPPPGAGNCRQGYHPFHNSCYRLGSNTLRWADAEGTCQKDSGHLASVNDAFEEAFLVTLATSTAPYWLGLSDIQTPGLYYWSDGSRMVYAKWGPREPSYGRQGGGNGCVLADGNGNWNDTDCSQSYNYVCKISTVTVPPTNPSSAGSCLDPTWSAVGDYCYYVNVNARNSWPEANFACQQRGMQLASVHSQSEFKSVFQMVSNAQVTDPTIKPNIWLGMSKSENGAFLWSDATPTNYLSWAPGQPAALGPNGTLQECVEFDRAASTWNTANCLVGRGYVCKARKVYPTTPMPTVPLVIGPDGSPIIQPLAQSGSAGSSSGLSGGGIAGIILGLLFAGLLVTFVILYLKRRGKILSFTSAPPSVNIQAGFDNTAYKSENDKHESDI